MSASQQFKAYRGDTIPFTFDQIVDLNGAAVASLAGWSCVFTLKNRLSDSAPRITKSTALSGSAAISTSGASFTWALTPAETETLIPGRYYPFDVQVTDPSNRVSSYVGTLLIDADVNTVNN